MTRKTIEEKLASVKVGDRIRLAPGGGWRVWWRVVGRDEERIVAVRQAAFEPAGTIEYTVIDTWEHPYNEVGPGPVRSSLNTLGGGWDIQGREVEGAAEVLEQLRLGKLSLSTRRVVAVKAIEIERNA